MMLRYIVPILALSFSTVGNASTKAPLQGDCTNGSFTLKIQPQDIGSAYKAASTYYGKCIADIQSKIAGLGGPENAQARAGLARANRKFVDNLRVATMLHASGVNEVSQIGQLLEKTKGEIAAFDRRDQEIVTQFEQIKQRMQQANEQEKAQLQVEYDLLKDEREQDTRSEYYHDLRTNAVILNWIAQNRMIKVVNYLNDDVQFSFSMN